MSKTMSAPMDRLNYKFLHGITKGERSDLSKAVRDLVIRGRILLAVDRYKKRGLCTRIRRDAFSNRAAP
jgi:hypothetical protein